MGKQKLKQETKEGEETKEGLALHWQIIIGLILGIIWAVVSSYMGWSQFTLDWIKPFGDIFIRLLKLIAVPLVLFSIIKGVSGIADGSKIGRMGLKTLVAYLITTVFAITIGLTVVNVIEPGTFATIEQRTENRINYEIKTINEGKPFADNKNVWDSLSPEEQEEYKKKYAAQSVDSNTDDKINKANNQRTTGPLQFIVDMVPTNIFSALSKPSMLQIIFFGIFFGIVLLFIAKEKAKPVIDLVDGINEVFIKMVDIIMRAAPFFVFALLAGTLSKMAGDDPNSVIEIFKSLGWYSITVVLGLGLMIFVVYPLIVVLITRKISYPRFFEGIGLAQVSAFSTSSSAATLPVTLRCVDENLGVDEDVTNFVLPIGATVNMDGTSMYQAIAVIFLAQFHMVDLGFAQQLTIVLTATLASIGSAAVPSAGLVMLILVLESVGLPGSWIAIIFPVDRILDMCRTTVNVTGDATVATVIAHSEDALYYDPNKEMNNFDAEKKPDVIVDNSDIAKMKQDYWV